MSLLEESVFFIFNPQRMHGMVCVCVCVCVCVRVCVRACVCQLKRTGTRNVRDVGREQTKKYLCCQQTDSE